MIKKIRMRILKGTLRTRQDSRNSFEVAVSRRHFMLGTAHDCHVLCRGSLVSPHHCEIELTDSAVFIRDLQSETGTYLNEQRIYNRCLLHSGDRITVGRLRFEILVDDDEQTPDPPPVIGISELGVLDEQVSQILLQGDDEARTQRLADPTLRIFPLGSIKAAEPSAPEEIEPVVDVPQRPRRPPKPRPIKLPPPPPIQGANPGIAAVIAVDMIFSSVNARRRLRD